LKAIVIRSPGDPDVLTVEDRPIPEPGPGEIRVRVRGSALNRADLLQRRGMYPAPSGFPADVPGLEYAGEVDAMGEGAGLWDIGSRVMGIIGGGAHAEYLCVHEREAIRVPSVLDWPEAAAVPEAFMTAYDALHRQLALKSGERVLIHAVGSGVGTAALQLAKAVGARTLGTSRTIPKLNRARELGLDLPIDASTGDWPYLVDAATDGEGVPVILDLVGGPYHGANLRVASDRGRIIVVGTVGGARVEIDLSLLLRKRLRVIGTVLRSRPLDEKISLARDFANEVVPLLIAGTVQPVIDSVHPFERIAEAHRLMEANSSFGKIVMLW
jgi:putative PIG3 family NAD(P)H quinone oxidoreductase